MGAIVSIVYQPLDETPPSTGDDFHRVVAKMGNLLVGYGLEGDAKGGRHPERQVNILSQEWLEQVHQGGYQTEPGSFGEQLVIQGLPLETLQSGDRLQLGNSATLEITKPRTGCERLVAAQGQSLEGLGGHVGMLARVVAGGAIRVGDPVVLLSDAAPVV